LATLKSRGAVLSTLPDETPYASFVAHGAPTEMIAGLASGAWSNARFYFDLVSMYLNGSYVAGAIICLATIALAVLGTWRMRRDQLALPLTVLASGALTLLWPWTQDRLVFPLLPFAGLVAATSLAPLVARLPRRGRLVAAGVIVTVALGTAYQQLSLRTLAYQASAEGKAPAIHSPTWVLPQNSRVILVEALWINRHARPDDRVLAATPAGLFLQTGRAGLSSSPAESRLVPSAFAVPGRFLAKAINEQGISLVLVEGPDDLNRDVGVVRRACPSAFHLDGQGIGGWPSFLRVVDTDCIARTFP
jgi:hypothetical protein